MEEEKMEEVVVEMKVEEEEKHDTVYWDFFFIEKN